jgi:cold shock CspA family protein
MNGRIIKFRTDLGYGIIQSEDGGKYRFSKEEIRNPNGRLVGYEVDFLLESRQSKDIFLMYGTPWSAFPNNQVTPD